MGRVAAPHGIRGACRVQPLCADPASLLEYPQWWLRRPNAHEWTPLRVTASRLQAAAIVAQFDGIVTRDAAALLRGATIGVPADSLPALADDEFYQSQLIGMQVVNRNGDVLGTVVEFVESGAHPIVRVGSAGSGERLIPWVEQYVDGVDVQQRRIDVDWPLDFDVGA
jgi:16S rRNA processing protein RimM